MHKAGVITFILYIITVIAANWAIQQFGMVAVGLGLLAPAGVYFAGLAFTLRDLTHETLGRRWVIIAILIGAGLSVWVSTAFALASGVSFLVAEFLDLAVYVPMRKRGWVVAVVASNIVGLIADSMLFLWLAFGSLDFLTGQVLGKAWMTAAAVLLLGVGRAIFLRQRQLRVAA